MALWGGGRSPILQMKRPRLVNLGVGIKLLTANGGTGPTRENRVVWLYGACPCPLARGEAALPGEGAGLPGTWPLSSPVLL